MELSGEPPNINFRLLPQLNCLSAEMCYWYYRTHGKRSIGSFHFVYRRFIGFS